MDKIVKKNYLKLGQQSRFLQLISRINNYKKINFLKSKSFLIQLHIDIFILWDDLIHL